MERVREYISGCIGTWIKIVSRYTAAWFEPIGSNNLLYTACVRVHKQSVSSYVGASIVHPGSAKSNTGSHNDSLIIIKGVSGVIEQVVTE